MSQKAGKSARRQKLRLNSCRSEVNMSSLVLFLSHLLPRCLTHNFLHGFCFTEKHLYKSTRRIHQRRLHRSTIAPSSDTPTAFKSSVWQNMLPTKPGQDCEPNLLGLLVRIMLTVFDLAGGLRGNGGVRSEVEGGTGRRFIFRLGATPRWDGFNRLIPYKSFTRLSERYMLAS